MEIIGWDIGGAHLKLARVRGGTLLALRQVPCALWQGVDRLACGLDNVNQPLMRTDLELLPRLLIDVRTAQHRVTLNPGRKWNWPVNNRARPLRRIDNFGRRLIEIRHVQFAVLGAGRHDDGASVDGAAPCQADRIVAVLAREAHRFGRHD